MNNEEKSLVAKIDKIISDPKSKPLEYTYEGGTLNGKPHGYGYKMFKSLRGKYLLDDSDRDFDPPYDLELLQSLKNPDAKLLFAQNEFIRFFERGNYKNGKLHRKGMMYDLIRRYVGEFYEGLIHGKGFLYWVNAGPDSAIVYKWLKGRLLTDISPYDIGHPPSIGIEEEDMYVNEDEYEELLNHAEFMNPTPEEKKIYEIVRKRLIEKKE